MTLINTMIALIAIVSVFAIATLINPHIVEWVSNKAVRIKLAISKKQLIEYHNATKNDNK